MRSAVTGIASLLVIVFTFAAMSTIARDSLMYQEASNACNEGIYAAFVMLSEDDVITSNSELCEAFRICARSIMSNPDSYRIKIYGVDYEKGILSAGISYSWLPWINSLNGSDTKTIEVRRTMIIDETD
ncbi:MAG: hypothetical protein PUC20_01335 [Firmicutes bacterium]|nr:hypothetical protein [Bacillota bacterium]